MSISKYGKILRDLKLNWCKSIALLPSRPIFYGVLIISGLSINATALNAAEEQKITIIGVARSVAWFMEISQKCVPLKMADAKRVSDYQLAFIESGEKAYGEKSFKSVLSDEIQRRKGMKIFVDYRTWCLMQKKALAEFGITDVFYH